MTGTSEYPVTDTFAADSGDRALTSKGAANKPNLTKNSKGDNKVAADAISRKSLPILESMTGRKGVSSVDVQSVITKPSFPPTNEVDQMKIPKLVNILHSGLRR